MTRYCIGSRANDGWDGFFEPGRPASDARRVTVRGADVPEGDYKWVEHAGTFVVATGDHSHHQLLVHLRCPLDDSVCGRLEVLATDDGRDIVFTTYTGGTELEDMVVVDRIEAWLRAGADLVSVDGVT